MASRPLPPGRRGRGGRTLSAQHLPEAKILSVELDTSTTTSYAQQLRVAASNDKAAAVEPEHESTAQEEAEPASVRSVKAFVATLERAEEPSRADTASFSPALVLEDVKSHVADLSEIMAPPVAEFKPAVARVQPTTPAIFQPPAPALVQPPAPAIVQTPIAAVSHPPTPPAPVLVANAAQPAPLLITAAASSPVAVKTAPMQAELPAIEGFHPFQLLLPVYSVPLVPEQVECVYDDEAVEMQKNIMKTIKKIFGKDHAKLEDFKINSRLYGNNFMDALEYFESLAKDLGGNRALQLVPCLLSIQPDFMKRNSMLVATRNFRMRNLAKLEAALDRDEVAVLEPAPPAPQPATHVAQAAITTSLAVPAATAPVVVATLDTVAPSIVPVSADVTAMEQNIYDNALVQGAAVVKEETKPVEKEDVAEVDGVVEAPSSVEVTAPVVMRPTLCYAEPPAELYVPPVEDFFPAAVETLEVVEEQKTATQASDVAVKPEVLADSVVPLVDASPIESSLPLSATEVEVPVVKDEPEAAAELTPVTIEVSPIDLDTSPTMFVSAQAVDSPAPSEVSSTSSAEVDGLSLFKEPVNPAQPTPQRRQSTINLFGEDIGDDDDDDDDEEGDEREQHHTNSGNAVSASATASSATPVTVPHAVITPVVATPPSSVSSYFEAESLFGEIYPVKAPASPAAHAQVPSVSAPAPLPPPAVIRPQHSGMLFGFGTAGDDSDSDSDSEFSD